MSFLNQYRLLLVAFQLGFDFLGFKAVSQPMPVGPAFSGLNPMHLEMPANNDSEMLLQARSIRSISLGGVDQTSSQSLDSSFLSGSHLVPSVSGGNSG